MVDSVAIMNELRIIREDLDEIGANLDKAMKELKAIRKAINKKP